MSENNTIKKVLDWVEINLTHLNLYLLLAFSAVMLILFESSLPEKLKDFTYRLFENTYWPFALVFFEMFRREVEKKNAKTDKSKLAKIEAVIGSGKKVEPAYILAIVKGRDGELASSMLEEYFDVRMRSDRTVQ